MIYYIFEVTDSTGANYFIVNNKYIGYVGFDSDVLRSRLEYYANVKRKYKKVAIISKGSEELHELFYKSVRLTASEMISLLVRYEYDGFDDDTEYEVFYPDKNSSESYLKSKCGKTIK